MLSWAWRGGVAGQGGAGRGPFAKGLKRAKEALRLERPMAMEYGLHEEGNSSLSQAHASKIESSNLPLRHYLTSDLLGEGARLRLPPLTSTPEIYQNSNPPSTILNFRLIRLCFGDVCNFPPSPKLNVEVRAIICFCWPDARAGKQH